MTPEDAVEMMLGRRNGCRRTITYRGNEVTIAALARMAGLSPGRLGELIRERGMDPETAVDLMLSRKRTCKTR